MDQKKLRPLLTYFCIFLILFFILFGQLYYSFTIEYSIDPLNLSGSTYQYNLWEGTKKLLEKKLYLIACLLIIWSGVWPYLKLVVLVSLLNIRFDDEERRSKIVEWLGTFGRFSFMDVWVITIICAAVNLHGNFVVLGIPVTVNVQAVGEIGIYMFFTGVKLSQILTCYYVDHLKSLSRHRQLYEALPSNMLDPDSNSIFFGSHHSSERSTSGVSLKGLNMSSIFNRISLSSSSPSSSFSIHSDTPSPSLSLSSSDESSSPSSSSSSSLEWEEQLNQHHATHSPSTSTSPHSTSHTSSSSSSPIHQFLFPSSSLFISSFSSPLSSTIAASTSSSFSPSSSSRSTNSKNINSASYFNSPSPSPSPPPPSMSVPSSPQIQNKNQFNQHQPSSSSSSSHNNNNNNDHLWVQYQQHLTDSLHCSYCSFSSSSSTPTSRTPLGKWIFTTCFLFCSLILFGFIFYPIFQIQYTSYGSMLKEVDYSIFTALLAVWEGSMNHTPPSSSSSSSSSSLPSSSDNRGLALISMTAVIFLPLLLQTGVLCLWFAPLFSHRYSIERFILVLSHGSCLDVFLLSMIVVLFELDSLMNSSGIGKYLSIQTRIYPSMYLLTLAVCVLYYINQEVRKIHGMFSQTLTINASSSSSSFESGGDDGDDEHSPSFTQSLLSGDLFSSSSSSFSSNSRTTTKSNSNSSSSSSSSFSDQMIDQHLSHYKQQLEDYHLYRRREEEENEGISI